MKKICLLTTEKAAGPTFRMGGNAIAQGAPTYDKKFKGLPNERNHSKETSCPSPRLGTLFHLNRNDRFYVGKEIVDKTHWCCYGRSSDGTLRFIAPWKKVRTTELVRKAKLGDKIDAMLAAVEGEIGKSLHSDGPATRDVVFPNPVEAMRASLMAQGRITRNPLASEGIRTADVSNRYINKQERC